MWLKCIVAVLAGGFAGVATAFWGISGGAYSSGTGHWQGDLAIGSTEANPYTRGRIARRGLLALSREEAIYFFRYRDEDGHRLDEACTYEISGGDLPSEWWSVTLYAEDDFLAQNDSNAHSVNSFLLPSSDGNRLQKAWRATIGLSSPEKTLWLSTERSGRFSLTLRLYQPFDDALLRPDAIEFPTVRRLSCNGGAA